jgi:CBS-domain-containing membrane protein
LIGVAFAKWIPDVFLAASLAVGISIGVMHVLDCLHPPGGATALAAVIGGQSIHDLGFSYALTPILLNVVVIFIVALVFNSAFPWRRYPVSLMRYSEAPINPKYQKSSLYIDKSHIEDALEDMDLVVDVASDDLQRLFMLSLRHAQNQQMRPEQIVLGGYYTNGKHGAEWSVRRVIDESVSDVPEKDMVIYRVVEGHGLREADSCTRAEFARWAAREVEPNRE